MLALGIFYVVYLWKYPVHFDSDSWKNWKETEAEMTLRWDMMNSLRKDYELKGMTKIEVIDLLGNPSINNDSIFYFNLGPSKRGINYGYLKMKFDTSGKVEGYIVNDH